MDRDTTSSQSPLTFLEMFQSFRTRSRPLRLSPLGHPHQAGFAVSFCALHLLRLLLELPVLRYCQTPEHLLLTVGLIVECRWTTPLDSVRCSAATTTSVLVAMTSHRCPSFFSAGGYRREQEAISRRDKTRLHIWRETACPKEGICHVFFACSRQSRVRSEPYTSSLAARILLTLLPSTPHYDCDGHLAGGTRPRIRR